MIAVDPDIAFRIALAVLAGLGAYRFLVPSARRRSRVSMAARLVHDAALYAKSGEISSAGDLLDRALAMLTELEPAARDDGLQVLVSLGQLALRLAGDERGPARLKRAHELSISWFGPDSAESLALLSAVAALHLGRGGEAALADERYRQGYDTAVRLHGREAPQTLYWTSMRAHALWVAGRLDEAEAMFCEVQRVIERTNPPNPDQLWRAKCSLAAVIEARGRFAEARTILQSAVARLETTQPPDRPALTERLGQLGWLHFELAAYADAEACFKRELSLAHQLTGEARDEQVHRARSQLAALYSQQARYPEAQLIYEELVAASTALWTDISNFAETLMLQGRLDESRQLFDRAITKARREQVRAPDLRDTWRAMGDLAVLEGKLDQAERAYTSALEGHRAVHGEDHPHVGAVLQGRGALAAKRGDRLAAGEAFRAALALRERWLGPDHPDVAASVAALARLTEAEDPAAARELHARALTLRRAAFPPDHPLIVESHAAVASLEAPR